jgi:predicted small lipoprotein YifL
MPQRLPLLLALLAASTSCGRSGLLDDPPAQPTAPVAPSPPVVREDPLAIFTPGGLCPTEGANEDLIPGASDDLVVVRFRFQEECSGAGGQWLVGRYDTSTRDLFAGGHACYFLPEDLRDPVPERFALVRFSISASLIRAPEGWCITNEDGETPTTDARWKAWAIYPTEAGARAERARLEAAAPEG